MFGSFGIPGERFAMKAVGALLGAVYRRRRSRVGGSPRSSARNLPASWPKKSPRRAGGRSGHCSSARATPCPVPNGDELEAACERLDLMVGIDLYLNETLAHCHYVLPATTMYERDDFMIPFATLRPAPYRQATEAVVAPAGKPGRRADYRGPDQQAVESHPRPAVHRGLAQNGGAVRLATSAASSRRCPDQDVCRRRPVRAAPSRTDLRPAYP